MLDVVDFTNWCLRLNLSEEATALIKQIRKSEPARRVGSFKGNVSGRYPSRKMGVTIQFESHKTELPFIHLYEHQDEAVLEYYDQPCTIKLIYEARNGRRLGVMHTPDFFVLRAAEAGWEECKTEEQLIDLAEKNSNRYFLDSEGVWRCPPGEAYAGKFGLYYRVRSSKEINWTYQRNIEFLDDYFRTGSSSVREVARTFLFKQVANEPGIVLGELFRRMEGVANRDEVFMLIAHEELYVDLNAIPLVESNNVCVFPDRDTATAYENLRVSSCTRSGTNVVNVFVGSAIQWGSNLWTIANVDETSISFLGANNTFTELPIAVFENLVQGGRITGVTEAAPSGFHPEVIKRLGQADRNSLAEANQRYHIISAHMRGSPLPANVHIPDRTLRYWSAQFRHAQEAYGNGYVGLLPRKRKGNPNDKLTTQTLTLLTEFIKNDYENIKQKRKYEVYAAYQLGCERRGIIPASYKTFCKYAKERPVHIQAKKRQGSKAAYKYEEFYWELDLTTPRHGERPFHVAHIDHTELDAELVCSLTRKNFGRAWATFLTDAYSRRLPAVYVTYDPPSYRSCMMVLRVCVRRFGRLPQIMIVDGGREFSSEYFETLVAFYERTKKTRPVSKGRFGSVCERLFGTSNTQFIHNLQGNTQIMRNVRQITKPVDPRVNALWTLEKLYTYLCEWAYEVYDTNEHPALGQSPREAFASGLLNTGERTNSLIPYDNTFRMLTLPTTRKTTAKVQPGRGVKINNIHYWADIFRHPKVEEEQVQVRIDPFDAGVSFAFALGQWHECYSEHYQTFRNRSEREIMLATAELRRKNARHFKQFNITALKLAQFLESVEAEEVLLRQRQADYEQRSILTLIDSGINAQLRGVGHHLSSTSSVSNNAIPPPSLPADASPEIVKPQMYEEF